MARKQKKLTRKQRLQQQEAVARQRQTKGWISPNEKAKQRRELVEDMAPLLAIAETGAGSEEENLFFLLADSSDLMEEPEFGDIFAEPLVTLPTYISVAEKLGFPLPDDLFNLPEEEQDEKKAEIIEETTRRLLTDELRQEILAALNGLRLRWKKEGQRPEAARAAGLQLVLGDRKSKGLWSTIGLVQAIVLRSLEAGFELVGVAVDDEADEADEDKPISELYKKLNDPGINEKLEEAIKKIPGLESYLDKQVDKLWEAGDDALFGGELNLGLFSNEELEAGAKIFNRVMRETDDEEAATRAPSKEQTENFFTELNAHLLELFTPERLEQLRARLQTILEEGVYPPQYFSYVKMMTDAMSEDDAVENEMPFLFKAMMGELQTTGVVEDDEAEAEADEEGDDSLF